MSHRKALLLLVVLQALFFNRVLLDGEVIYPHDNHDAVAAPPSNTHRLGFQAYTDHSDFFIPELHHHLNGRSYAWISTWNPHAELGRPTSQMSGLSTANLFTRLFALFTHDAFRVYTVLCVFTVCLSGIFFFAFLETLGLSAPACLCASAGLSLGMYQTC